MPIKLNFGDMLDEEKFFQLCQINELVDFERDSEGNVIVLPLSGSFHGNISARLTGELCCWNMEARLIDRFDKKAYIYRADGSVEIVEINAVLSGENVLPDFALDLGKLIK